MKSGVFSLLKLVHFWFPVALGWSIAQVVHRATGAPLYSNGVMLFLSGIWAAYSLDRLADSKTPQPLFLRISLILGLVFSIALCAFSAAHLSLKTLSAVLVFSFLAVLYRRLKKYPLLKTLIVAMVWVWAGVALSIANDDWFGWNWLTVGASFPLFLLIAAGCILCDLKDVEADTKQDVKSLPVLLGIRRTILVVTILAGVACAIAVGQNRLGLVASGAAMIAVAQYPRILAVEDVGPLIVDFILTLPGILIAAKMV
jgi:4-hydroxybenzoate polyprenyltransferase